MDQKDVSPSSRSLDRLRAAMPGALQEVRGDAGVPIVRVAAGDLVEISRFLKEDPGCRMRHLQDLCGVDMMAAGRPDPRFDVVYHLFSLELREQLALKVAVAEGAEIPTVSGVWRGANWHEREAFDMFGIRFTGHPDLRRILMPEDYVGWPQRRDFPVGGEPVTFTYNQRQYG